MARLLDFGDRASGRVVDENDNFRLVRPYRTVSGLVSGVFPYAPKNVTVTTASGERLAIRVEGR
jgi:hypothetical protein